MNQPPYFPDDDAIAALRQQLTSLASATAHANQMQRIQRLRVDLAWALRQRDTREAMCLLEAADAAAELPRALLVSAEAAWLYNRNAEAMAL